MTVTEKNKTKGSPFFGFWLLFAILVGGSLIGGIGSMHRVISRQRLAIAEKETVSNALQIGRALHKFESQYGSFPDEQTKFEFDTSYVHKVSVSGISSNALFRQIIAPDIASEDIFFAHLPHNQKPDNLVKKGQALKPGSCGFSYITNLTSKDDPLTPIVLTPLIPGTKKFDPKPFAGKAVVLQIDGSVRTYDIAKDGHIYDDKGIDLLSPKNPIWKGKAPDIHYPE
jgi:hypothetical protein